MFICCVNELVVQSSLSSHSSEYVEPKFVVVNTKTCCQTKIITTLTMNIQNYEMIIIPYLLYFVNTIRNHHAQEVWEIR